MAKITIFDLRPTGSDFFSDSESYMNEMTEGELNSISGGDLICTSAPVSSLCCALDIWFF